MVEIDYVYERVWDAIECLSGGIGTFEERLFDAWVSGLGSLYSTDPNTGVPEKLCSVLILCRDHIPEADGQMTEFTEDDRRHIAQQLMHVLIEGCRLVGNNQT
jgi:hypothetical protein